MAPTRSSLAFCAAAAAAAAGSAAAFLAPGAGAGGAMRAPAAAAASIQQVASGLGAAAAEAAAPAAPRGGLAVLAVGAHLGLAAALLGCRGASTARRAEKKAEVATKYVESATDQKLFEQVYTDYTIEYLKGPMYWHEDKLQGVQAGYAGEPMQMNKRLTSNNLGNLKTFSSNELAFLAFLFFGIGLYGNLMFWVYDPQFLQTALGNDFNVSYIVESFFLPMSFFFHIGCWIQRRNGK